MTERIPLIATVRALPAPVWALLGGTAVNKAGDFLQLFIVLMVLQRPDGGRLAAAVLACYGVGELLGVAASGPLTDRYGARLVVVVSMAVNALAVVAVPALPALWLCVACGIGGAAAHAYRPASAALLAVIIPAEQRVPVFALQRMALNVGVTVAPLLGAALAAVSYPALFAADAATSVVFVILAAVCLPRQRTRPPVVDAAPGRPAGVLRDRAFGLFCAALLVNAVVYLQYLVVLPMMVQRAGLPVAVFGVLVAANAALVLAIELPLSTVTARLSPRLVIVLGIVLVGVGEAAYGLVGGLGALIVGTFVWSVGEAFATPVQSAYAVDAAPPGREGSYASAASAAATVGYAFGPAAGALLIAATGPTAWAVGCLVVTGLAALIAAVGVKRRPVQLADPRGPEDVQPTGSVPQTASG